MSENQEKEIGVFLGGAVILALLAERVYEVVSNAFTEVKTETTARVGQVAAEHPSFFDHAPQIGLGVAATSLVGWAGMKIYQAYRSKDVSVIRIYPKPGAAIKEKNVVKMLASMYHMKHKWWKRLYLGRVWIRWMIHRDKDGKYHYMVLVPKNLTEATKNMIKIAFPGAQTQVEHFTPFNVSGGKSGHMKMASDNEAYGLRPDVENNMHNILMQMPKNSMIDIRFSPTKVDELKESGRKGIRKMFGTKKGPEDGDHTIRKEKELKEKAIRERYFDHVPFDVSINLWAEKAEIAPISNTIQSTTRGLNSLILKSYTLFSEWRNPIGWQWTTPLPWRRLRLTETELANLTMFPDPAHEIFEEFEVADEGSRELTAHEFNEGVRIGVNKHKNQQNRAIRIKHNHFRYHMFTCGATGQGKGASLGEFFRSFVESWLKDPMNHPGLTLLDPHRQSGELLFNILLDYERKGYTVPWDRVRYLHFGRNEYPIGLNLIHKDPGDDEGEIAKEAADNIISAFPGELSKTRTDLENAILTLLYDDKPHTINEIVRLFRDGDFRTRILQKVAAKNPNLMEWWAYQIQQSKNGQINTNLQALVTRLNPFLMNQTMQRMYCQEGNVLNAKEILDGGHIVFADFKEAPPETLRLTAGYIANRYHREMKKRPGLGRIHLLIADEAQMFEVPVFHEILKEDRKFGFGLWLLTQDITELGQRLAKALMVNAHTFLSLNPGEGASTLVSKIMGDKFSPEYLDSLKPLNGALYSKLEQAKVSILLDPPAFMDEEGKATAEGSPEEMAAKQRAMAKAMELQKREGRHYVDVDDELFFKVTGQKRRRGLKPVGKQD
jgi:hypothetical protein